MKRKAEDEALNSPTSKRLAADFPEDMSTCW